MGNIKNLMIDIMNQEPHGQSADDPCPICEKLKDENGVCNCKESWV